MTNLFALASAKKSRATQHHSVWPTCQNEKETAFSEPHRHNEKGWQFPAKRNPEPARAQRNRKGRPTTERPSISYKACRQRTAAIRRERSGRRMLACLLFHIHRSKGRKQKTLQKSCIHFGIPQMSKIERKY